MQDNLGGDFKEFQSAYEAVGTDLFDQQEGALRKLTQTATKYVLKLDGWIQKNKSLASTIGLIAGGALALTGIIGAIGLVAGRLSPASMPSSRQQAQWGQSSRRLAVLL